MIIARENLRKIEDRLTDPNFEGKMTLTHHIFVTTTSLKINIFSKEVILNSPGKILH